MPVVYFVVPLMWNLYSEEYDNRGKLLEKSFLNLWF